MTRELGRHLRRQKQDSYKVNHQEWGGNEEREEQEMKIPRKRGKRRRETPPAQRNHWVYLLF